MTASHVFGVAPEDVSVAQRSKIKAMNYGLAYGLSAYGLSNQLKVSVVRLKNSWPTTSAGSERYMSISKKSLTRRVVRDTPRLSWDVVVTFLTSPQQTVSAETWPSVPPSTLPFRDRQRTHQTGHARHRPETC